MGRVMPAQQKSQMVTLKADRRKRKQAKNANIADVRSQVETRDKERCRLTVLLQHFGAFGASAHFQRLDLAHVQARGMGGNPDLSRDTPENTLLIANGYHTGARSLHSGHLKIRALTDQGTNGPVCFEFYEKLPSELD